MDAVRQIVDHVPVVMAASIPIAFVLQLAAELWSWSRRSDLRLD